MRRYAVTVTDDPMYRREPIYINRIHPIHAVFLSGTIALFLGSVLADYAYFSSYQIQWADFASWLTAGGLVFGGCALIWSIISLIAADRRTTHSFLYSFFLLATWVIGFLNSLTHAKDAWAVMPMGLILSVIVFVLACISTCIGMAKSGVEDAR